MQFKSNTIKKLLCTVLACAAILSCTACSDREKENKNNSNDTSISSSASSNDESSSSENKTENKEDKKDKDNKNDKKDENSSSSSEISEVNTNKTVKEKIADASKINSDVVGWLTVPNTKIDNEILQGKDNSFYERRDINKNYEWYGCYYADYESVVKDKASLSPNTVIYGHNMEDRPNGKKFAQLMNFLNEDFAKNNPYIYLETPKEKLTFQVFAVFYTDAIYDSHYAFVNPEKDVKTSKYDNMEAIIEDSKSRSQFIYDVDVNGNDKILTLSTCTYKYGGEANKEQRFVIQARLLRDGETEKPTVSIKKNPSPKEPKFTKEY